MDAKLWTVWDAKKGHREMTLFGGEHDKVFIHWTNTEYLMILNEFPNSSRVWIVARALSQFEYENPIQKR